MYSHQVPITESLERKLTWHLFFKKKIKILKASSNPRYTYPNHPPPFFTTTPEPSSPIVVGGFRLEEYYPLRKELSCLNYLLNAKKKNKNKNKITGGI